MFTSGLQLPAISNNTLNTKHNTQQHNTMIPQTHQTWNQHPPESMPWGPLPQHRVTRFSGELGSAQSSCPAVSEPMLLWNTPQENWNLLPSSSPIKRKIEDPGEEQIRKQLITEDKISAHLSQLQIGSPTVEQIRCRSDAMDDDTTTEMFLEGIKLDSCSKLVLSEEILNFQHENSIPASLLESFNRPSMAVVLWQPRNTVDQVITRDSSTEQSGRAEFEENPSNDLELINEDESNNNQAIDNFNLNEMANQSDLEMDDDL